eukprot:3287039-Alexandrium_andersonii.AAC.1
MPTTQHAFVAKLGSPLPRAPSLFVAAGLGALLALVATASLAELRPILVLGLATQDKMVLLQL